MVYAKQSKPLGRRETRAYWTSWCHAYQRYLDGGEILTRSSSPPTSTPMLTTCGFLSFIFSIHVQFHADPAKNRIATVLTGPQYLAFIESANRKYVCFLCMHAFFRTFWCKLLPPPSPTQIHSPMFLLPVFRGPNAFENFALQCQNPYVLFTSLEDFKLYVHYITSAIACLACLSWLDHVR